MHDFVGRLSDFVPDSVIEHWFIVALVIVVVIIFFWLLTPNGQRFAQSQEKARQMSVLNRQKTALRAAAVTKGEFTPPEGFVLNAHLVDINPLTNGGIAVDQMHKQLWLISPWSKTKPVYPYSALLSVEITEDGQSISSTSRKSQAAGVIIGALALGGFGALLGGLTGSRKTIPFADKLSLRLILNGPSNPVKEIVLLNKPKTPKSSPAYMMARKTALDWQARLEVVMAQADEADKAPVNNLPPSSSSADEIRKLAALRAEGLLTDSEFSAHKAKLLG